MWHFSNLKGAIPMDSPKDESWLVPDKYLESTLTFDFLCPDTKQRVYWH